MFLTWTYYSLSCSISLNPTFTERLATSFSKLSLIPTRLRKCISLGLLTYFLSPLADILTSLLMYTKQLAEVEASIREIMDKMDSVIKTIPGIGYLNGAMIIGEIGDMSRFENPCHLLAYAGLDPYIYQSGNFNASRTRMSKRRSKLLRYALINASRQTTLVNKTFKNYYDLKISQGRRHYNVLGHVAHKLVRVIHKMMTDNVEFGYPIKKIPLIPLSVFII